MFFTLPDGTPLYNFIEFFNPNTYAEIYVKVPMTAYGNVTVYMWLCGPQLYPQYQDPSKIFLYRDEFDNQTQFEQNWFNSYWGVRFASNGDFTIGVDAYIYSNAYLVMNAQDRNSLVEYLLESTFQIDPATYQQVFSSNQVLMFDFEIGAQDGDAGYPVFFGLKNDGAYVVYGVYEDKRCNIQELHKNGRTELVSLHRGWIVYSNAIKLDSHVQVGYGQHEPDTNSCRADYRRNRQGSKVRVWCSI